MKRKQYSPKERMHIISLHNGKCDNCGSSSQLVIHHIVPLAVGGAERASNLSVLCHACHNKLHTQLNNKSLGVMGSGRKPHLPEQYEVICHDYIFGHISGDECVQRLGLHCPGADLKRRKWFKAIMSNWGVKDFHNEIDYIKLYSIPGGTIHGKKCGWVKFENGDIKNLYYGAKEGAVIN